MCVTIYDTCTQLYMHTRMLIHNVYSTCVQYMYACMSICFVYYTVCPIISLRPLTGQIDFYMFDPEPEEDDSVSLAMLREIERLGGFPFSSAFLDMPPTPPTPPVLPPKPKKPDIDDHALTGEAPPIPYILLLPRVARTKVTLTFTRRQLEEYMDR